MNAVTCIVIVLVCWNILLTIFLAEHIMETREYLKKMFKHFITIISIIKEMEDEAKEQS